MKCVASLIAFLIWLSPLSVLAVELRWNPDGIEQLVYKTAAEVDITDRLGEFEPKLWLENPVEFDRMIARLKRLPLRDEYLSYHSRLKALDGGRILRVKMVGVPVRFKGEPADEREAELRDFVDLFNGTIRLQGDMDLTGNSAELTFYRAPKERNIMTQFFYLPGGDVSVGDHWPLPVQPIELGAGFFVQDGAIHNRVMLTGLRPSAAGTVAELRYLVNERVEGYVERLANTQPGRLPYSLNVTLFGYGEFLVEKGHWLRQVTVIDYAGGGHTEMHKQQLFALELDERAD